MQERNLLVQSEGFLRWLEAWMAALPTLSLAEIDPRRTALISVDLVRGFCTVGPLASPRVQGIVPSVVQLFRALHARGVRHFLLTQDTHREEAPEFAAFPPHCLAGSEESQTIPELLALPFSDTFVVFEKNSLSSTLNTGLTDWLSTHPDVDTFFVVGDCTDLCVYAAAMGLRLRANAFNIPGVRVIVPADCVQTYDLPVTVAEEIGAMPHDGDLLHAIFLYAMALNGIEVVAHVEEHAQQ